MMVESFEAIGFGQGFRYFTGLVEVSGAVLLWWPNRQAIGASLLGATMVGAVLTHLFIIGPSALPAIVIGLLCATVLFLYRNQIPSIFGHTRSV